MRRALGLAARGRYTTAPNPRVGCIVARLDASGEYEVIGEGYHHRAGEPHAEVLALREAGEAARGATAFVTLEPCSHHGRTPPCCDALLEAGIANVVAATIDPFPEVAGEGLERLAAHGVTVEQGCLETEARWLNRGFVSRFLRHRPWLALKVAVSLDGRIATRTGDSRWITGPDSRAVVHRLRAESDAVMVGAGTFRADDPRLTARDANLDMTPEPTLRVVLAGSKPLPEHPRILDAPDPILLIGDERMETGWPGIETFHAEESAESADPGRRLDLGIALRELAERNVGTLLVEGGATLATELIEADRVDELLVFVAPVLIGGEKAPSFFEGKGAKSMTDALRPHLIERRCLDQDVLFHLTLRNPSALGLSADEAWPEDLLGLPWEPTATAPSDK